MNRALRDGLVIASAALLAVALHQSVTGAQSTAGANGMEPALPRLLSETGLYSDAAILIVSNDNRPFVPQYPLWSDGAQKRRWVHLPAGKTIDASSVDHWTFPDGTRFWKEFAIGGRRVETRMLWKVNGDWRFAAYAWNDQQTDADLVPERGLATDVEVAQGRRHRIPATFECRACHDSARTEILGFNGLQLSDDRDPLAPHAEPQAREMVSLGSLLDDGRLAGVPTSWRSAPPRIEAPDRETRAVLGYMSTNCGSCHNRNSSIANLGLDLKAIASSGCAVGLATIVDQPSIWSIPSAPEGQSRRVLPGRPDLSSVIARMRSRRPSSQMPPLGTVVADAAGIALLTSWVEADAVTWSRRLADCTTAR